MTSVAPPYRLPTNRSEVSLRAPTLPPYTEHAGINPEGEDIELANLSLSRSSPSYSPTTTAGPSSSSTPTLFTPTRHLQIQTPGKPLLSFPTPQRPDPIPIFTLTPSGRLDRPLYLSLRPDARSGSCLLARADDAAQTPLSTTTYRFGPGRPPVVVLLGDPSLGDEEGEGGEREQQGRGFEILGAGLFSRAVRFAVPGLGSLGWRYAGAGERASAGADSLLVCEVFPPIAMDPTPDSNSGPSRQQQHNSKTSIGARLGLRRPSGGDQDGENGSSTNGGSRREDKESGGGAPRCVAQLVRNETLRTPGTARSSAGNGGRLMMDLSVFDEKARERAEWLIVTTAIIMLKREVDRRRAQQIAAIGAIAS
ncbi:hypothetical protein GGS24DRAFT_326404 [Hypoxylon argillaceum]|nr:hypothetical protein GGS24DRAFT_326404 [Hypoxylon argillaceum]